MFDATGSISKLSWVSKSLSYLMLTPTPSAYTSKANSSSTPPIRTRAGMGTSRSKPSTIRTKLPADSLRSYFPKPRSSEPSMRPTMPSCATMLSSKAPSDWQFPLRVPTQPQTILSLSCWKACSTHRWISVAWKTAPISSRRRYFTTSISRSEKPGPSSMR